MRPEVERWRTAAAAELSRQGNPLPVDLVLAVIHVESRGKPGLVNPKSGASGLMQVMPGTLDWFNKQNSPNVPLSALRSPNHPGEQIRVGIWVMGQFWKGAYKYLHSRLHDIPTEELAKIADLFYVAGPGATKRKLDKLAVPFFDEVAAKWPTWNALPHPRNVFKQLETSPPAWNLEAISKWLHGAVVAGKRTKENAILVLGILLIVYWFLMRGKENGQKDSKKEKG